MWVVNRGDGTLSRVDPATNAVSGTVPVGTDARAVAVGEAGCGSRVERTAPSSASIPSAARVLEATAHRQQPDRAHGRGRLGVDGGDRPGRGGHRGGHAACVLARVPGPHPGELAERCRLVLRDAGC